MSKASIFKGKLVTSRCCLDDGLRRTGDWSEAGITLSCCCSVICSVSPDRHWLVLIMATRGAGGNWSEKRTQNTRTVEPAEGQAHTDTRQEDAGWIFTYLSPSQQLTTHCLSALLTVSLFSHCARGCVMETILLLYVEPCLCLAKDKIY